MNLHQTICEKHRTLTFSNRIIVCVCIYTFFRPEVGSSEVLKIFDCTFVNISGTQTYICSCYQCYPLKTEEKKLECTRPGVYQAYLMQEWPGNTDKFKTTPLGSYMASAFLSPLLYFLNLTQFRKVLCLKAGSVPSLHDCRWGKCKCLRIK